MFSVSPSLNRNGVHAQTGAALVLALLVVAIVVLLASSLAGDFLVTFKRVENQLHGHQATAYLRGAEAIARRVLREDMLNGANIDHRSEGWLNQTQEFPMAQGVIIGTLCDYQARFNVNNVAQAATGTLRYSPDQELFIRLLQVLVLENPLDQSQAEEITHAVIDWIDEDDVVTSTGGAEDSYYSDLMVPMRPANQPLQNISELRWVKGISNEIYQALAPHVVALAPGSPLNVNTARVELLRAINESTVLQPISEPDAMEIIASRDGDIEAGFVEQKSGFEMLADFVAVHPATVLSMENMAVKSDTFLLQTETLFLGRQYGLYSVLQRDSNKRITTIARGNNDFGSCVSENR